MLSVFNTRRARARLAVLTTSFGVIAMSASAQAPLPNPPRPPQSNVERAPLPDAPAPAAYPPMELDRIVSPIALYPDPLLAQTLTAATFPDDIPDAARWADQHHYLTPDAVAAAIAADRLPWEPSVQALLPFPSVLEMMASALPWTRELGDAFLAQPQDVMDAVQRMRQTAMHFGYLRSNRQVAIAASGPYVEILPVNPAFIVVPYYEPAVVFARPRPGFRVATAIVFSSVRLGPAWAPWGWGTSRFVWNTHTVIINNAPWRRSWANRVTYVHPYTVRRAAVPRAPEQHRAVPRTEREREADRAERRRKEEHRR
jgi:hypothetical protein